MSLNYAIAGVLGAHNKPILGRSFMVDLGESVGGEVGPIYKPIQERVALASLTGINPTQMSMVITSTPMQDSPVFGMMGFAALQMRARMKFTTGNSRFGALLPGPPPAVGINRTTLCNDIIFDANGIMSIPAATGFELNFEHVTLASDPDLIWAAGLPLGPRYQVNVGYNYGTAKSACATLTDVPTYMCANGTPADIAKEEFAQIGWARPCLAKSVSMHIRGGFLDHPAGSVDIYFQNCVGHDLCSYVWQAPFDEIEYAWPNGADYVYIDTTNLVGAVNHYFITPIHQLFL